MRYPTRNERRYGEVSSDRYRRVKEYFGCVLAYLDELTTGKRLQSVATTDLDGAIDFFLAIAALWELGGSRMRQMMEHFWVLVTESLSKRSSSDNVAVKMGAIIIARANKIEAQQ